MLAEEGEGTEEVTLQLYCAEEEEHVELLLSMAVSTVQMC